MDVKIQNCRLCNSKNLIDIFDLGKQPPANSLRSKVELSVPYFSLKLLYCNDCSVTQLDTTVDPKFLFDDYLWVTATSLEANNYSNIFCKEVLKKISKDKPFVLEIASNDGTFLLPFKERKANILGVDPAKKIALEATNNGIPTINNFFNKELAHKIYKEKGRPDILIARNVIPHVKEINSIIEGISEIISNEGIAVIEFHYSKKIIEELHYDSIYHEHLFYFSLLTISNLFKKYGMFAFDLLISQISGGSLVLFFSKLKKEQSESLKKMISEEKKLKLNDLKTWNEFAIKSKKHSGDLKKIVEEYSIKSKLIGYGASARSSTMLNYSQINSNHIEYIIDKNPLKKGLITPGTDIPIVTFTEGIKGAKNRNVLLLAWNFKSEIVTELRENGFTGDIIVPLPNEIIIL